MKKETIPFVRDIMFVLYKFQLTSGVMRAYFKNLTQPLSLYILTKKNWFIETHNGGKLNEQQFKNVLISCELMNSSYIYQERKIIF